VAKSASRAAVTWGRPYSASMLRTLVASYGVPFAATKPRIDSVNTEKRGREAPAEEVSTRALAHSPLPGF
jgi:hypothetical protein